LSEKNSSSRLVPTYFSRFISQGVWKDTPVPHWIALIGFVLIALAISIAGWQIFSHQKQRIKNDRQNELEAIADLKVKQLLQWRQEKMGDAELVRNNRILAGQIGMWIKQGMPRSEIYNKLKTRMTDQQRAHRLHEVLLLDVDGQLLLKVGTEHDSDAHINLNAEVLQEVVQGGESVFTNIYWAYDADNADHVHQDLYIPLLANTMNGTLKTTSLMVFRIDPERYLYPMVVTWPNRSASVESILLRPEEDGIVTLAGRRHIAKNPGEHFAPPANRKTPPGLALAGKEGIIEHLDYRDVPVLSVVRKVDGSPWFLVTKMDISEIYAPVFDLARTVFWVVLAFVLATGVTAFHWWRQMRASYLAGHYRTELERQALEQRFNALTQYANDIILLVNSEGRIVEVNNRGIEAFGFSREGLLGLDISDLRPAREKELSIEQRQRLQQEGSLLFEAMFLRRDGSEFPVEVSARLIELDNEFYFQGILRDISERKKAEEQIQFLAHHDPLTSLPNRFLLQDRLSQCIARAHRNRDRVAILYLDFDRFKNINDSLGHSVGDEVLQAVAERLQTCIREGDTVARIGGDEFVLLLPDLKEGECVVQVAKKILDLGNKPYAIGNYQLRVTVSVGISVYPDDGTDVDSLLKNADAAMYHAKAAGRDSYYYYTQDMNARALDILQMENSLQSALDNQEFHLCYQPQVDLASGRIVGAEALLRWNHPEKGEIPPGRFIPVAEDRGLISPIGAWVIETACRQNRQWQQEGLRPVQVAVNISAQQLHHAEFSSHLQAVLEETGLSPSLLELELTESAVMQDAEQMIDLLNALKKLGLSLAIDDFGTGYSSLSYLKRFPIDRLKIDQSFIKDLTLRHEEEAITQAIIGMGRTLKMKAIAEGVETDEQLRFLKQAGCDEIQGFLFSKPLPAEEFAQLLAADRRLDGGLPASG